MSNQSIHEIETHELRPAGSLRRAFDFVVEHERRTPLALRLLF
jgi:hypothetical protein